MDQLSDMTREKHLEFCSICLNRKLNPQVGLICKLTNEIADFEETCKCFELDEKEQQLRLARKLEAAGDGETGDPADYHKNKERGIFLFFIGLSLTLFSLMAADSFGFVVVASGAMVTGLVKYFRGKEQEQILKKNEEKK